MLFSGNVPSLTKYVLQTWWVKIVQHDVENIRVHFLLETQQVYGHACNGCKGRLRNALTYSSR